MLQSLTYCCSSWTVIFSNRIAVLCLVYINIIWLSQITYVNDQDYKSTNNYLWMLNILFETWYLISFVHNYVQFKFIHDIIKYRYTLAFTLGELLQKDLNLFVADWNSHPIRRNRNTPTSPHGCPDDIYAMPTLYSM